MGIHYGPVDGHILECQQINEYPMIHSMVFSSSLQDSDVTNLTLIHLLTHLANIFQKPTGWALCTRV